MHFTENEWFSNTELKKEFEIKEESIEKSFGDEILWKEGKNITVKVVKKKNKKKKETKTKTVREESFFNFFRAIDLSGSDDEEEDNGDDEQDEKDVEEMEQQHEIADEIYENIVPRSLEYFLGVVTGGAGDFGDLAALGGGEEFDDEEDEVPKKKKSKGK